jgi:hypothetical protein
MTPLEVVADAFTALTDGPEPVTIDATHLAGLPDRELSLRDIADNLQDRATTTETKDLLWAALVTLAREAPAPWTYICAGLALPGLRNAVRKAAWLAPTFAERADIESAAIEGFTTALPDVDLVAPRIIRRLCNSAHTEARRYAKELGRYQKGLTSVVYESRPPRRPDGHVDFALARAVRDRAINEDDVRMIQDTFLEGQSVNAYAEAHGLSADQVTRWRRRVKESIAKWFHDIPDRPSIRLPKIGPSKIQDRTR